MADNVLFDVDASQILAKLHLAGRQPLTMSENQFIVNTGIVNDDLKAKPDKVGNVKFDLKNSRGVYEVGYVTVLSYRKNINAKNDKHAFDEYKKASERLVELYSLISGKDSEIEKTEKDDKNNRDELDKLVKEFQSSKLPDWFKTIIKDNSIDITKAEGAAQLNKAISEKIEALNDDVNSSDTKNDTYNAAVEALQTIAIEQLTTYMNGFAGKENIKNIDAKNVKMIVVSPKVKSPNDGSLVKMFEIQPIAPQEREKMLAQFALKYDPNDVNKSNCDEKVCFKIKYNLNIDK